MSHRILTVAMLGCVALVASSALAAPKKTPGPEPAGPVFDKSAAVSALVAIKDGPLQKCRVTNTAKGEGHVMITFAPSGEAQSVALDKGPWIGTPVAKCIQREFKKAKVPAFSGDAVTVGRSFRFD